MMARTLVARLTARRAAVPLAAVLLVAAAGAVEPAWSQSATASATAEEVELLQAASEREAAGELEASERLLRKALESRRSSVPAVLGLERVLRIQGRLEELPPLVERAIEEEPESALLNRLLVRTYSELDQVARLEEAASAWIEKVPTLEVPYREVARVWESRGEYGRARSVLEEGRRRSGNPDALALELGDLYQALGEPAAAVEEWARSIDGDGRGLGQVRRRLHALPHAGADVVRSLVDRLARDDAPGRVDAALELAVEARLEERARSIAEQRLPELSPEERRSRLDRLARESDAAGLTGLAHWAYDRLVSVEGAGEVAEGRFIALEQRRRELARELDDSAAAPHPAEEEADSGVNPGLRRGASVARIEILAGQDAGQARDALDRFRESYPESPELDQLTAVVARALLDSDRESEAVVVLTRSRGPHSSVLRARLLLAEGDVAGARAAYLAAAAGLRGSEATAVLGRVRLLGRISDGAAALVGQALVLQERERAGAALDLVTAALDGLDDADAPALLELAAGLADEADLPDDAASLRRRLVESYPRSPEAPGALLRLGHELGRQAETRAEARELLERLIIEYPRSALVPEARQALNRLVGEGRA